MVALNLTEGELAALRESPVLKEATAAQEAQQRAERAKLVSQYKRLTAEYEAKLPGLIAAKVQADEEELAAYRVYDASVRKTLHAYAVSQSAESVYEGAVGELRKELVRTSSVEILQFRQQLRAELQKKYNHKMPSPATPPDPRSASQSSLIIEGWRAEWTKKTIEQVGAYQRAIDATIALELTEGGHTAGEAIKAIRKQLELELKKAEEAWDRLFDPDPKVAKPNRQAAGGPHTHREL